MLFIILYWFLLLTEAIPVPQKKTAAVAEDEPTDGDVDDPRVIKTCKDKTHIAMTYDDGPSPNTEKIAAMFKAKGMKATFFFNGPNFEKMAGVVDKVKGMGMQIANHGNLHEDSKKLGVAGTQKNIEALQAKFTARGIKSVYWRPPYGSMVKATLDAVTRAGYKYAVHWTVDTNDWQAKAEQTYGALDEYLKDPTAVGPIVLAHDKWPNTVTWTKTILDKYSAKYKFVSMDECMGIVSAGNSTAGSMAAKPAVVAAGGGPTGARPELASSTTSRAITSSATNASQGKSLVGSTGFSLFSANATLGSPLGGANTTAAPLSTPRKKCPPKISLI